MNEAQELDKAILDFIKKGKGACPELVEGEFEALALRLFAYQFERNAPYRQFCKRRGVTQETVSNWRQIPCVPTNAFKVLDLACEPIERAQKVFLSSGTTQGSRSRHYVFNLSLYEASVKGWFVPHLLPEARDTGRRTRDTGLQMPMLILFPAPEELPASSLGHMLSLLKETFGSEGSGYFIRDGKLLADELAKRLADACEPVFLLGTSFSFMHFLDYCLERKIFFSLPPGSRLMDTGGFKGKSREVPRHELYALYEEVLGIPQTWCINEYGMCEMSSQFYDGIVGQRVKESKSQRLSRRYVPPPWVRTVVVHPETLEEVGEGEIGILRHYDLANRGSVMAIQTDDLGRKAGDGFELLGRAQGSELKGCSLLIEELLGVSRR